MSISTRTHEDEVQVTPWWGTLTDVLQALERADAILHQRNPEASIRAYLSVDCGKTNDVFHDTAEFAKAFDSGALDITKLDSVYASYEISSSRGSNQIVVWFKYGATVTVTSGDLVWLEGVLKVMEDQLAANQQPSRQRGVRRPNAYEAMWLAVATLLLVAVIVVGIVADYSLVGYAVSIGVWLACTAAFSPVILDDMVRPRTEPLRLLSAALPTAVDEREGLIAKLERFIRARPLLNLALTFLFGIAVTKVSDLL